MTFLLEGIKLTPVTMLNYLSITIDRKGSFGPHIGKVAAKAEKQTAKISKIMIKL